MIISLDLNKTYGQQNEDIAKKNKITKISLSMNKVTPSEDSEEDKTFVFNQNLEGENTSKIVPQVVATSSATLNPNMFLGALTSTQTPRFPTYMGNVIYKEYTINIDLNNPANQWLKNINSSTPFSFAFNGTRNYLYTEKSHVAYKKNTKIIDGVTTVGDVRIPYNDLVEILENLDLISGLDNLQTQGFWEENEWTSQIEVNNGIYYAQDDTEKETPINVYDEIIENIQTGGNSVRNENYNFTDLNKYFVPTIKAWDNNGSNLKITLQLPHSVYLFGSKLGYEQGKYTDFPILSNYRTSLIYENAEMFKYSFSSVNLTFSLNYTTETENVSYYAGNREYKVNKSFIFTEGNHLPDNPNILIDGQPERTEYTESFANEIYESYKNGKMELSIKYPVGELHDINGGLISYAEGFGLIKKIGDDYFDQDGNSISVSSTNNTTTMVQIPEGTLCQIVKSGNVVYKNNDGTSKYFLVKQSNLVYTGILVNELILIESSERYASAFDETSWEEIDAIGKLGELDKHFKVGDKKYVNISDQPDNANPVPFVILGFNHDELPNGNGKAGMTVGMESVLYKQYPINDTRKTPSGWGTSDFRSKYAAELISKLPQNLQSIIKPVNKKSIANNTTITTYNTTEDKLFLLSFTEILGQQYMERNSWLRTYFGTEEGKQYEYWDSVKDGTVVDERQKLDYTTMNLVDGIMQPVPVSWVSRSFQLSTGAGTLGNISSSGELIGGSSETNMFGISYAFCVGEKVEKEPETLEDASWGQIKRISEAGNAQSVFSIGEEKTITMKNGDNMIVRIIGFNQDVDENDKPIGITFECKNVLNNTYFIEVDKEGKEYSETTMAKTTLPSMLNTLLPEDLANVIKTTKRKDGAVNGTSQQYFNSKLFILGYGDIVDLSSDSNWSRYWQYTTNGVYQFYNSDSNNIRVKTKYNETSAQQWWLSTAQMNYDYIMTEYVVGQSGNIIENIPQSNKNALSFCFCI